MKRSIILFLIFAFAITTVFAVNTEIINSDATPDYANTRISEPNEVEPGSLVLASLEQNSSNSDNFVVHDASATEKDTQRAQGQNCSDPIPLTFPTGIIEGMAFYYSYWVNYIDPPSDFLRGDQVVYQFTVEVPLRLYGTIENRNQSSNQPYNIGAFLLQSEPNQFNPAPVYLQHTSEGRLLEFNGDYIDPGTYFLLISKDQYLGELSNLGSPRLYYRINLRTEIPLPVVPHTPYPDDLATNQPGNLTLTWNNSYFATAMDLYFGKAGETMALVLDNVDPVKSYKVSYLNERVPTTYNWKVVNRNSSGEGERSFSFTVKPLDSIPEADIIFDSDNHVRENLPMSLNYNYSISQSIYHQSEFNLEELAITSISYFHQGTTSNSNDIEIFMKHTTKDAFSEDEEWEYDGLTHVYSGKLHMNEGDPVSTIILDTPFFYNDRDNLMVQFFGTSPHIGTSDFYSYPMEDNRSLVNHSRYDNFFSNFPRNPGQGSLKSYLPVTGFNYILLASEPQFIVSADSLSFDEQIMHLVSDPQTLTIANRGGLFFDINSVIITGTNSDQFLLTDENSYPVSLGVLEEMLVSVEYAPTTGFEHTAELQITDDQGRTVHTVQLEGNSVDASIYEINIPYAQGFEDPATMTGWNIHLTSPNERDFAEVCKDSPGWHYSHNGEHHVKFSFSEYSTNGAEIISPIIIPEMDEYRVRFWARKYSNSATEPLIIGKYDAAMETFIQIETIDLTTSYAEYIVDMVAPQRAHERFAFRYKSMREKQDIYIDDITFEAPPTAAMAELNVAELNFATQDMFITPRDAKTVKIRNVGIGEFNINEIELIGANADEFAYALDAEASMTLANNESLDISVKFTPTAAGVREAELVITDDLGNRMGVNSASEANNYSRNANSIALTGVGNDITIYSLPFTEGFEEGNVHDSRTVTGWNNSLGNTWWETNNAFTDENRTPRSGNFNVTLTDFSGWLMKPVELVGGHTYDVELYARQNYEDSDQTSIGFYYGRESSTESMIEITGQVGITNGGYQLVSGRFFPATSGTYILGIKGDVKYNYLYPKHLSIDDITLKAVGPTIPVVSISETALDFGRIGINEFTSQEVIITNTTGGTLSISAIEITGSHADQFSYSTTADVPVALAGGQSLPITVNFAPLTDGHKSATLVITDNLGNRVRIDSAAKETTRNANQVSLIGEAFSPLPGSNCANPIPLTLPTGAISGTTEGFMDDYSATWITPNSNDFTGNDVVYQFTLASSLILQGSIECDSQYFSAFILQSEPNATNPAPVIAQANYNWQSGNLGFDDKLLPAGDYFLIISSGFTQGDESYTLNLRTTQIPIPEWTHAIFPENDAMEQSTDLTLSWINDRYAESLDLYFGEAGNMALILNDVPIIDEHPITNLSSNTTYEWKVVNRNQSGSQAEIETWSFTTVSTIPEAVSWMYPENNSTDITVNGRLFWDSVIGASSYRMYFGIDNQFNNDDYVEVNGDYYIYNGLDFNTSYYWKVVSYNILGDANEESEVYSFTTTNNPFPEADIIFDGARDTDLGMPMEPYCSYSITQNIYEQAELDMDGAAITAISYLYNNYSNWSETIEIYMKHTDKSTFSDEYDWEIGDFTQVYSGTMSVNTREPIVNLTLDTPFTYNNRDNLVVMFHATQQGYQGNSASFYSYQVDSNRSLTACKDGATPYVIDDESVEGELKPFLPVTGFNFETLTEEPQLNVSNETITFLQQATGTESEPKNLIISNLGQANLTINNVTLTGLDAAQFRLSDENDYPVALGFKQNMTISVVYAPTNQAEEHTAELQITDNQGRTFRVNSATKPTTDNRGLHAVTLKGFAPVLGSVCSNPLPLELPAVNITGKFGNYFNDYAEDWVTPSSWNLNGDDVVYQFTVAATVLLNGTIENSAPNLGAFILQDEPNAENPATVILEKNTSGYDSNSVSYVNEILPAGTYYLIISSNNYSKNGEYTINLTTDPLPIPSGVTDLFPANDATNQPTDFTLSWVNAEYTETIDLYFGKADAEELPLVWSNVAPVEEYQVADLEGATTYKWKIVSRNESGETEQIQSFTTTGDAPVAVNNLTPANASTNCSPFGNLNWSAVTHTSGYRVYLGIDASFAGVTPVVQHTTSHAYSQLDFNTTYYWKVVPYNGSGQTEQDVQVWSFTTYAKTFPEADIVLDGTRVNESLPINPGFEYTMTKSIYKQAELNIENNLITSISYLYNKNSAWSKNIHVRLSHTDKNAFSSDYGDDVGFGTLVYSGELAVNTTESIVTINFDEPFYYNNIDNLAVSIYDLDSKSHSSEDKFFNYSVEDYRTLTAGRDSDPFVYYYYYNVTRKACLPVTGFNYEALPEEPVFTISDEVLSFGKFNTYTESSEKNVRVDNNGVANLNIEEIIITGADADQFYFRDSFSFPVTLGYQDGIFISVVYAPTAGGDHTAELQIIDDQGRSFKLNSEARPTNNNRDLHSVALTGICVDTIINQLPFTEGFEEDDFYKWNQYSENGNDPWTRSDVAGTPRSGEYITFLRPYNTRWLMRPVELIGGQSYKVELYVQQNTTDPDRANIGIYYGPSTSITAMTAITGQVSVVDSDYQKVTGTFIPATSGIYFIGIKGVTAYAYMSIDDIMVYETAPIATLSAPELDFGVLDINESASEQLSIMNTGGSTLNISTVEINGANADQFSCSIADGASMILAENQALEITVVYAPTTAGDHTAQLQITDNVGRVVRLNSAIRPNTNSRNINSVDLTGTFIDNTIYDIPFTEGFEENNVHNSTDVYKWTQVSESGANSWIINRNHDDYNRAPRTGNFSACLRWSSCNWLRRTIELRGGQMYNIELYARQDGTNSQDANIGIYYGPSATTADMIPVTGQVGLVNGDYQQIEGSFTPATSGIYYLGIKGFTSFDSWHLTLDDLTISEVPMPIATLSATELDFGMVTLNTSSSEQLTVTNTGIGILNIATIEIAGIDASEFSWSTANGASTALAADETLEIEVTLTPTFEASKSATLIITDNFGREVKINSATRAANGSRYVNQVALRGEVFTPLPGSICANPIPLTFPTGNVSGNTAEFFNDYSSAWIYPSSDYLNGDEVVYQFTLAEACALNGTITTTDSSMGAFILKDVPNAANPANVTLEKSSYYSNNLTYTNEILFPGTYFLIISSNPAPQSLDYVINLTVDPLPPTFPDADIVFDGEKFDNQKIPMHPYYGFSISQSIYKQAELNIEASAITSISYLYNQNSAWSETIEIFMKHTAKDNFENTNDWEIGDFSQVYSGSMAVNTTESIVNLVLDNPFIYNGADNLVILFYATDSEWASSSDKFYSYPVTGNRTLSNYSDDSNFFESFPNIATRGSLKAYLPVTGFNYQALAEEPQFNVNAETLTFTDQIMNTESAPKTLTISNLGLTNLGINSITLAGTDLGMFELRDANDYPATLSTGENIVLSVVYAPTIAGEHTAELQITDDQTRTVHTVQLIGNSIDLDIYEINIPYTVGFETEAELLGWTTNVTSDNDGAFAQREIEPGWAHTGDCSYLMYQNDWNTKIELISPLVVPDMDAYRVKFWALQQNPDNTDPLVIGKYDAAMETFTEIASINLTDVNNGSGNIEYTEYIVNMTGAQRANERFAFKYESSGEEQMILIDDITFEAIPTTPVAALSVTEHDFGTLSLFTTSPTKTVTITNVGINLLTINNIELTGLNVGDFAFVVDAEIPLALAASESLDIAVTFVPTTAGAKEATLVITDDLGTRVRLNSASKASNYNRNANTVVLTGEGLDTTISSLPFTEGFEENNVHNSTDVYKWAQVSEAGYDAWTINETNTDYNRTPRSGNFNATLRYDNTNWLIRPIELVGGQPYDVELYARQGGTNWGNANIGIYYGTTATTDAMVAITEQVGLTNGNYQLVSGSFIPDTDGIYFLGIKGFINNYPYYISLDDVTIRETSTTPIAHLSVTELDFGVVYFNESTSAQLSISNTGEGTLTINTLEIEGLNSDQFRYEIADGASMALALGQSLEVTVVYAPTTGGDHTAELIITDDLSRTFRLNSVTKSATSNRNINSVALAGTLVDNIVSSLPFTEGFEENNVHNSTDVYKWEQVSEAGSGVWKINKTYTNRNRTPRSGNFNATLGFNNTNWLIRPVELLAGQPYDVELYARQDGTNSGNANIGIYYGTTAATDAMIAVTEQIGLVNGDYQLVSGSFIPDTDGIYFIGIKGFINGSPWYISLDDITIREISTSPIAHLSVTELDFGVVNVNESASAQLSISNRGMGILTIATLELEGINADEFSCSTANVASMALELGQSLEVTVVYAPTTGGDHTADLIITDDLGRTFRLNSATRSNTSTRDENSVALAGNCPDYPITSFPFTEGFEENNVHGSTVLAGWAQVLQAGNSAWTINETNTDYNRTPRTGNYNATLRYNNTDWLIRPVELVGGQSYDVELYARQDRSYSDNANIGIYYGTTAGPTAMIPVTEQVGLVNGDYQLVSGRFIPATDGIYFIGIKGFSNNSPYYISLDDITIRETSTTPTTTVSVDELDFGPLEIEESVSQQLSISNRGIETLNINTLEIEGFNADQFSCSVASGASMFLELDQSLEVTVIYAPTIGGDHTAELKITDDQGRTVRLNSATRSATNNRNENFVALAGSCLDPTIASFPFTEGFEEYNVNFSIPLGWSQVSEAGYNAWIINEGSTNYNRTPRNGNFNATLLYNNTDWLMRPVELVGGQPYEVELYARQNGENPENASVGIYYGTEATTEAMEAVTGQVGLIDGDYQLISGRFIPDTDSIYFLGIKGDINNSPYCISLDDITIKNGPTTPTANFSVTDLDFGRVNINDFASEQLLISNTGEGTLTINTLEIEGLNSDQFRYEIADGASMALALGQSLEVTVVYAPTMVGDHTAELKITDDQGRTVRLNSATRSATSNRNENFVALAGTLIDNTIYSFPFNEGFEENNVHASADISGWSQLSEYGDDGWIINEGDISYNRTPRSGNFNATLRYSNTDWLMRPVELVGGQIYHVELYARQTENNAYNANIGIYYGAEATTATMEAVTEQVGLRDGDYQLISGRFTPATDGIYFLGIKGKTNGGYRYISLDDITIKKIETTPVATLSVTDLDFGTVNINKLSSDEISITNSGIGTLNISNIELEGANANEFRWSIADDASMALTEGQSLRISVAYAPTTGGEHTAELQITDDLGRVVRLNSATRAKTGNRNLNSVSLSGNCPDSAIFSLPFIEGFEENNVHASADISGWSQLSEYGVDGWTINETAIYHNRTPRTGDFNACLFRNNTEWLIKPLELEGGQSYDVELYARQDGANATRASIGIYYGTTSAPTAMTHVTEQVGLVNGDYQLISGTFTPATDGIYYLGIKGFMSNGAYWLSLDDFAIKATSVPIAVTYSAPADNSLDRPIRGDLSWQAATSVDGYKVYLGTDEQFSDVTPVQQLDTSYTYSGLDYSETYFWKVIAYNIIGETTEDISVWSFTTMADPSLDLPVYVDFNSSTTQPAEIAAGNMSISEIHGKNSNGMYNHLDDSLAMAYVQFHPLKNITTGTEFSFKYRIMEENSYPSLAQTIGTDDYIQILVSENGGDSYTTVKEITALDHVVSPDFVKVKASLDAYAGKSITLRVEAHRATNDYYVDFDNFYFGEAATEIVILPGEGANDPVIAEYVELQFTEQIEDSFTVDVIMIPTLPSSGAESTPKLTDTFVSRHWRIESSIDNHGIYDITFDLVGLGIDNYNLITFYKRANSSKPWEDVVSLGATLSHNESKVTISGLDKFSEFVPAFDSTLPVTLASFSAIQTTNNLAQINWTTASENSVLGYDIYRAETEILNDAIRITPIMVEALNASTGASYSYVDKEVELDMTYYYWLQTNDFDGTSQTNGPVTVKISSDGEDHDIEQILLGTQLFANYPNPFNPSTTISFSVAEPKVVTINVYNLRGQLIKKVFDMKVNEINVKHNVMWNGQDSRGRSVASGIYFTIMEVGGKRFTNKAVLMK